MKIQSILLITCVIAGLLVLIGCGGSITSPTQNTNEKTLQFVEFYSPT